MPILFVPKAIRDVYFLFKDIFADHNYGYLDACSILLFFLTGSDYFCQHVRNCPWSPSVSTLSRLSKSFNPNRFMRRNRERIFKFLNSKNHADFCFAVDDTSNPKYGSQLSFSSYFGRSGSQTYFGQKILVLVIVDLKTKISYPISYCFLTSKKDLEHIPAQTRAIDLIKEATEYGFPPLTVTADSWFDSKEFIESVRSFGCVFAGEVKANRLARYNINANSFKQKLPLIFRDTVKQRLPQNKFQKRFEKRGKAFSEKILFLSNLFIPIKIVAVYNRINGIDPFAFYATTELTLTGARLWKFSRARWAIEVMFRDLKQSLGFGFLSAGGEGGAHMAVCIPLVLITSMRINSRDVWSVEKKDTVGTIVKKNREFAFSRSLDLLINSPDSEKVLKLRARRSNPNQKPRNFSGETKVA